MTKNLFIPDWCEAPLPRPFVKADDLSGFHDLTPLHAASSWRPWMPLRAQEARAFCRVKRYPCAPESFEAMACSEPVFRPVAGLEARERAFWAGDAAAPRPRPQKAAKRPSAAADAAANMERSMRRAATQMRDICLSTPFRYFVTLTLDPAKIDRHDMEALTKVVNRWADNRVRRNGLAYVLVPERHKDGAIHLHGFVNESLPLSDSGTMKLPGAKRPQRPRGAKQRAAWEAAGAKVVYNIPGWTLGFSTAIPLGGSYEAAVAYCCKYVRKAAEKIGGRWFYRGGKCAAEGCRPVPQNLGRRVYNFRIVKSQKKNHVPGISGLFRMEVRVKKRRRQCGTMRTEYLMEKEVERVLMALMPSNRLAGQRRFGAAPVADRAAVLDCREEDREAPPGESDGQIGFGDAFGVRWD